MANTPASGPASHVESPVDQALALLLADEPVAALRWAAAALERDKLEPTALLVTARSLARMGRKRAAIDGLGLAARRGIETRNLPIGLAAIHDQRELGVDVAASLDQLAGTFCREAVEAWAEPLARATTDGDLQPLSRLLTGPALASKATQMIYDAIGVDRAPAPPLPLFGALTRVALRELLAALDVVAVPQGRRLVAEGAAADAGYVVACGGLEISRRAKDDTRGSPPMILARLGAGASCGEMALLSRLPAAATIAASRPSILLVAQRARLESIATGRPDVGFEVGAHCRRQAVANLGSASPVMAAIPPEERAELVERMEMRVFQPGERLVSDGEEAPGLHLIVAGEVAVVARDGGERVVLATHVPGDTIGEVELVLCRTSATEAIATRGTATLFLPREDFFAVALDRPSVLHGLYAVAVQRSMERTFALAGGAATVGEECVFEERAAEGPVVSAFAATVPGLREVEAVLPLVTQKLPAIAPPPVVRPPAPRPEPAPEHVVTERMAATRIAPIAPRAPRSAVKELEGAGAREPSSLAPTSTPVPPPRPSTPGRASFARKSVQGAAVVAVAASVAAVLATRDDTHSFATSAGAAPTSNAGATFVTGAPAAAPISTLTSTPTPISTSTSTPTPTPPAPPLKTFLVAPLTKRRPTAPRPPVTADALPSPEPPPAPVSAPTPSPAPAPAPRTDAENEFGGRE